MSKETRYCFMSDDDGHDYIVPVSCRERFNELTARIEKEDHGCDRWYELVDLFENKFSECRCDAPECYSFENYRRIDN